VLVTGAAGFIGANFAHYWAGRYPGDTLVAYDALTYAGNLENLAGLREADNFHFVHADICDFDAVCATMAQHRIDTVVHFAAESHVDRSITGPDAFIETNVVGTHTLLKAARAQWLGERPLASHRFHHVSTDEVYGSLSADAPGFHEQQKYEPNSPYSASKAASDHLVRAYQHTYGLQVTTSNCSNNYGPYHFPEKLIPLCITNILRGLELPVYGDGSNIRDWLYVEDHCRGIELVLNAGTVGETYNIGGNNEWSNLAIVELLCDQMDACFAADASLAQRFAAAPPAKGGRSRDLIRFVEDRAGHDWRYAIDAGRISQELGYTPQESFDSGLSKTLHWFLGHESWWRPLLHE
tara:strand:+ start:257100 stop:258155 length:1056 start_codon:yes stop_codon:yes gene_type:complete